MLGVFVCDDMSCVVVYGVVSRCVACGDDALFGVMCCCEC